MERPQLRTQRGLVVIPVCRARQGAERLVLCERDAITRAHTRDAHVKRRDPHLLEEINERAAHGCEVE
jgi:hypothetical protein